MSTKQSPAVSILQWDPGKDVFRASPRWERYSLSSLPAESLLDPEACRSGIDQEDFDSFLEFYAACKKGHGAATILRLLLRNGETQLVFLSVSVASDASNAPDFVVAKIVEIDEGAGRVHSSRYKELPIDENGGSLVYEIANGKPRIIFADTPLELDIALSVRNASALNAVFLAAYDLDTGDVLHFAGEMLPAELYSAKTISGIKKHYLEYVHEDDIKKIVYNELRLHEAHVDGLDSEEIVFEGRVKPPSEPEAGFIWVEISFIKLTEETGRRVVCVLARDITRRKHEERALLQRANLDPYTTILPRVTFEEFCASQRKNRIPENWINAVLLIDASYVGKEPIRGIERIDLLDKVSERLEVVLARHIDSKNYAARFGDSVFLMSMHDLESHALLRERVYQLQGEIIEALDDERFAVCIGVTLCHHDRKSGFRCIFDDVEQALISAKSTRKSQIVFYGPGLNDGPSQDGNKPVYIRTFGYFDVFVNDEPVLFKHRKAKELLAILVDRQGAFVSNTVAAELLWEDEVMTKQVRARFRKVAMWLNKTLADYGIEDIVETAGRARRLREETVVCDLYNYLSHDESHKDAFVGSYMNDYSWAEITKAELCRELFIR